MYIFDPDFRTVLYELISRSASGQRSTVELNKEKAKTVNNFLFSSLNLQSVCSILSGMKEALKESKDDSYIYADDDKIELTLEDFKEKKVFKIRRIQVLNHEYFEKDQIESKKKL